MYDNADSTLAHRAYYDYYCWPALYCFMRSYVCVQKACNLCRDCDYLNPSKIRFSLEYFEHDSYESL